MALIGPPAGVGTASAAFARTWSMSLLLERKLDVLDIVVE
jgi:hypothetical protein